MDDQSSGVKHEQLPIPGGTVSVVSWKLTVSTPAIAVRSHAAKPSISPSDGQLVLPDSSIIPKPRQLHYP